MSKAEESLNPQERQMYDGVMDNAAAAFEPMLGHLSQSENPVADLGLEAGRLFHTMLMSANKAGKQIPQNISQVALKSLVEDLMEISVKTGVIEVDDQAHVTKLTGIAFSAALESYVAAEQAGRKSREGQAEGQARGQQHPEMQPQQPQQPAAAGGFMAGGM